MKETSALGAQITRTADVAARHATAVDEKAQFPLEAVNALRDEGLLTAWMPTSYGGLDADLSDLVDAACALGRSCSSSAAVFIDHQVQIARLVRLASIPSVAARLNEIASNGLLLGSAALEAIPPSDGSTGPARSVAAGAARALSSVRHVDALLLTFAVDANSHARNTLLLLQSQVVWEAPVPDSLGYRGASPHPTQVTATAGVDTPAFSEDDLEVTRSQDLTNVLWTASWDGMAQGLRETVLAFLSSRSVTPTTAQRSSELAGSGYVLSAIVKEGLRGLRGASEANPRTPVEVGTTALEAAKLLTGIALGTMTLLGMQGFSNRGRYSVARALRDAMGAPTLLDSHALRLATADQLVVNSHG